MNGQEPDAANIASGCNMFQTQPDWIKNCDHGSAQSIHSGGILVTLCDGSVKSISPTIDTTAWKNLCDPMDGNVISGL